MEGTALWKLKRRVELSVNIQPQGIVGERPWTDKLLPNTDYVQPWGVQCLSVPHEASGKPECTNCDRTGRDDDAWHILFGCTAFQLYQKDAMTTVQKMGEQPLTPDSLVSIMLKSTDGWDEVATFVALTMRCKMEIVQERQSWHMAATT